MELRGGREPRRYTAEIDAEFGRVAGAQGPELGAGRAGSDQPFLGVVYGDGDADRRLPGRAVDDLHGRLVAALDPEDGRGPLELDGVGPDVLDREVERQPAVPLEPVAGGVRAGAGRSHGRQRQRTQDRGRHRAAATDDRRTGDDAHRAYLVSLRR